MKMKNTTYNKLLKLTRLINTNCFIYFNYTTILHKIQNFGEKNTIRIIFFIIVFETFGNNQNIKKTINCKTD